MAKMKIDLSGVKAFLAAKGEKLALGVTVATAGLLIAMGLLGGKSIAKNDQGQPLLDALRASTQNINSSVAAAQLDPAKVKVNKPSVAWDPRPTNFVFNPLIQGGEIFDTSKRNPVILPIPATDENRKTVQLDYIRGGVLVYDLDREGKKVPAFFNKDADKKDPKAGKLLINVRPSRYVVVSTVFPYRDQVEEFRKALRISSLDELLKDKDNAPKFLGLVVTRHEISGGKSVDTTLYTFDPAADKNLVKVHEPIETLLRSALIDEDNPKLYSAYLHTGLITPLPRIANLSYPMMGRLYPRLQIEGINLDALAFAEMEDREKAEGKAAMAQGGGAQPKPLISGIGIKPVAPIVQPKVAEAIPGEERQVPWSHDLVKELRSKFEGRFYPLEPYGMATDDKRWAGKDRLAEERMKTPQMKKEEENPAAQAAAAVVNDALVRFIDVDVEPGKTYKYTIQVRVANPNYGKHSDVGSKNMADIKELISPPTTTPSISIPGEFEYYAVDQSDAKIKDIPDKEPRAPVQIHRWFTRAPDGQGNDLVMADWGIAEKLLVRRGEYIGKTAPTGMLVWNKPRGSFVKGESFQVVKKATLPIPAVQLNFTASNPPPLLVDFDGGTKKVPRQAINEEAAFEMLIMTPDGKLTVRNTRVDAEDLERQNRLEAYRDRLNRNQPVLTDKAGGGGNG